MACVEEDAVTAELEGVLEEERKENSKQGGCPQAAFLLSTANFERAKYYLKSIHILKRNTLSTLFIFEFMSTSLSECLHRCVYCFPY